MREFCSQVVESFGTSWAYIGWGLFLVWFFLPFVAIGDRFALAFWGGAGWLLLCWWLVDLIDQQVPLWMILVGIVMLVIGFLPRGGLLTIACWVLYWTKVRESKNKGVYNQHSRYQKRGMEV